MKEGRGEIKLVLKIKITTEGVIIHIVCNLYSDISINYIFLLNKNKVYKMYPIFTICLSVYKSNQHLKVHLALSQFNAVATS